MSWLKLAPFNLFSVFSSCAGSAFLQKLVWCHRITHPIGQFTLHRVQWWSKICFSINNAMDRFTNSICVWTTGKKKIRYKKRKENCKMNELGIRGCKRWTRPDLKIRNSQTRAVNEWGIGIFSKIYNDHIYSPTQPAYAGPQGQPMELQGLKISDIVHIFWETTT